MTEPDSKPPEFQKDGFKYWQYRYDFGDTKWYRPETHPLLVKHYNKLNPDGQIRNILLPLCGKSVDLDWLSEQGLPSVVGVDGVLSVLQTVVDRSGKEWTESEFPGIGAESRLLARNDGKMALYCGDMLKFTTQMLGQFDAMWDRGGLIVMPREDVRRYVQVLKDLLATGGRILLESIEFDGAALDPVKDRQAFPPFPMFAEDIRKLFEPECYVENIERTTFPLTFGKSTDLAMYLIVKK